MLQMHKWFQILELKRKNWEKLISVIVQLYLHTMMMMMMLMLLLTWIRNALFKTTFQSKYISWCGWRIVSNESPWNNILTKIIAWTCNAFGCRNVRSKLKLGPTTPNECASFCIATFSALIHVKYAENSHQLQSKLSEWKWCALFFFLLGISCSFSPSMKRIWYENLNLLKADTVYMSEFRKSLH